MIHVGPAGYPAGSKGPSDAVERAAALGFDAMELQFVRQARMADEKAIAAGRKAKELGVLLSAHAPYYINLNSPDRGTVEKSKDWVLKTVRIAAKLGVSVVVVHAAAYSGKKSEDCTDSVVKGLRQCLNSIDREGLKDVSIGLETMGKRGTWGTIEEIGAVIEEVEGAVPVIDFAHLHARSGGGLSTKADFESVLTAVESYYHGPLHCHFSCIEFTGAGERRHLPLSARQPDFSVLASVLKHKRYDVTVISETPEPEKGAAEMRKLLKQARR